MYHYLDDKAFQKTMRNESGKIMQELCHILKEDYEIGAIFYLVGSGARNLILQNESESVDLDYNLEIVKCEDWDDCRAIKESVRKAFNSALHSYGWGDCMDSTSAFTTEKRYFSQGNHTPFSLDVCIVTVDTDNILNRLIHEKTGWAASDRYYWNQAPNSKNVKEKADFIKSKGKWSLVRDQYLKTKNRYLTRNNHSHPSYICYIETVNNIYNTRKQW